LSLLALTLFAGFSFGQTKYIRCYSDEVLREEIRKNPERGRKLDALNKQVDEFVSQKAAGNLKRKPGGTIGIVYIPVIVNVVYRTNEENISEAQIQSQMDVLNKDYSRTNVEYLRSGSYEWAGYLPLVADFKIQFCLAGIIRKQTTVSSWSTNDAIKKTSSGGQDPTDPETKLNIWTGNLGGGLLGYAMYPGGPAASDGVVCLYSAFGTSKKGATAAPYDEGRTMTHEVGHWLGLAHTFQGGCSKNNDYVEDTPPTKAPTFGCPAPFITACRTGEFVQSMNYMDYTEDLCMYMFTTGQKARADGFIAGERAPYCLAACPSDRPVTLQRSEKLESAEAISVYPTITGSRATISIPSVTSGSAHISLLDQSGSPVQRRKVALNAGTTQVTIEVSTLPSGMYIIKVMKPNGVVETRKLIKQ
jgi:hypothetical protein